MPLNLIWRACEILLFKQITYLVIGWSGGCIGVRANSAATHTVNNRQTLQAIAYHQLWPANKMLSYSVHFMLHHARCLS